MKKNNDRLDGIASIHTRMEKIFAFLQSEFTRAVGSLLRVLLIKFHQLKKEETDDFCNQTTRSCLSDQCE